MASFFETLGRSDGTRRELGPRDAHRPPGHVRPHRRGARSRAAQFDAPQATTRLTFELIRERVRVLTATGDVDMARAIRRKIARGETTLGNRYGEALALMQSATIPRRPCTILQQLVKEHQD